MFEVVVDLPSSPTGTTGELGQLERIRLFRRLEEESSHIILHSLFAWVNAEFQVPIG
jgi:hypothetical protein